MTKPITRIRHYVVYATAKENETMKHRWSAGFRPLAEAKKEERFIWSTRKYDFCRIEKYDETWNERNMGWDKKLVEIISQNADGTYTRSKV